LAQHQLEVMKETAKPDKVLEDSFLFELIDFASEILYYI